MSRFGYLVMFIVLFQTSPIQAGALERLFAPKAELWESWQNEDADSTTKVDHQIWDGFLNKYVVSGKGGINRIAYGTVSEADKKRLQDYIQLLQGIRITHFARPEQKAYWVNLYNAVTVSVVLEHYPVKSIRDIDISPGLFSDGPWGKKLVTIEKQAVSLNDIEHRILRPIWKDPRIHYALNCASLGCPNLINHAFYAQTMDEVLDDAARNYVNHPRGVSIQENGLNVSSIYSWFQDDFGGTDTTVIEHLKQYANSELKAKLMQYKQISSDAYDWRLNDLSPNKSKSTIEDDF